MIIRRLGEGHVIATQRDHALASGDLARLLRREFFGPGDREEVITATARHDDGWVPWDATPQTAEDGRPLNFDEVEGDQHFAIWKRGIEVLTNEVGPFAGAMIAAHARGLGGDYAESQFQYYADRLARLPLLAWPDLDEAERELRVERGFRALRFCDLLTLMPAAGWTEEFESVLVDHIGNLTTCRARLVDDWTVGLDAWPFEAEPVEVPMRAVTREPGEPWSDALARLREGHCPMVRILIRAINP